MSLHLNLGNLLYNIDETGVSRVVESPKIVAQLGREQVG
jgi:hypothetical protein